MKRHAFRYVPLIAVFAILSQPPAVHARPQYYKAFVEVFPDQKPLAKAVGCSVCHMGKSKKNRNPYGKALENELAGKNVKDPATIRKALRKIGRPKVVVDPPTNKTTTRTFFVSTAAAQSDVADIPSKKRTIAAHKRMTYFLIPPAAKKPPKDGYGLLVLLPGGSGSEAFHPFIKRIRKHAVPKDVVVAQPIAFKWTEKQRIVWPTDKSKVDKLAFSTEQFIDAVIKDVQSVHKIDGKRINAMGWSSSGPAIYAAALRKKTPLAGSYIMMSVYKPKFLPPVKNAKGRRFYIEHSPDDRICPHWMAKKANTELKAAGANVQFAEYKGGHGFRGNIYGRMRTAFQWLDRRKSKTDNEPGKESP